MHVAIDAELADLIPRYLRQRWADLGFARELLGQDDFVAIAAMGHRLKGNAASYGFAGLSRIAADLELAAEQQDGRLVAARLLSFEAFLRTLHIEYV